MMCTMDPLSSHHIGTSCFFPLLEVLLVQSHSLPHGIAFTCRVVSLLIEVSGERSFNKYSILIIEVSLFQWP